MPCRKFFAFGTCDAGCDEHMSFCHRYYRGQRCHFGDQCRKLHSFVPYELPVPKAMPRPSIFVRAFGRPPPSSARAPVDRSRSPARAPVARTMDTAQALAIFNLASLNTISRPVLDAMYRSMALERHPDKITKCNDNDETCRKFALRFAELNEAYNVLKQHAQVGGGASGSADRG